MSRFGRIMQGRRSGEDRVRNAPRGWQAGAVTIATALLLLFVAMGVQAGHETTTVPSFTGCVDQGGDLVKVAPGYAPKSPCTGKQVLAHFSGGDITAVTAGTGLTGGGTQGSVTLGLDGSYRLPQSCSADEVPKWNGSAWACATFIGSSQLGDAPDSPATNCVALQTARPGVPSGVYWLDPDGSGGRPGFRAYCDLVTDGGGWTLVWSNLRGERGKPITEMQWAVATTTLPRVSGTLSSDLESFTYYVGLWFWQPLAPVGQLRYSWANDYGSLIDQSSRCTFSFGPIYNIGLTNCTQLVGSVQPGLITYHNNLPFSTYDSDHDSSPGENCSTQSSNTPWWYGACWNGSINGGGEFSDSGHFNGAYWNGSASAWGTNNGDGAGNGWIYVR